MLCSKEDYIERYLGKPPLLTWTSSTTNVSHIPEYVREEMARRLNDAEASWLDLPQEFRTNRNG